MESQTFDFPTKPGINKSLGKPVKLLSNFFGFRMNNPKEESKGEKPAIHKFDVKFTPDLPQDSKIRARVVRSARDQINAHLHHHLFKNLVLFSLTKKLDMPEITTKYEDFETKTTEEYKLTIKHVQEINHELPDYMNFFKIFFNSLLRKLRLQQIGKSCFNPKAAHKLT